MESVWRNINVCRFCGICVCSRIIIFYFYLQCFPGTSSPRSLLRTGRCRSSPRLVRKRSGRSCAPTCRRPAREWALTTHHCISFICVINADQSKLFCVFLAALVQQTHTDCWSIRGRLERDPHPAEENDWPGKEGLKLMIDWCNIIGFKEIIRSSKLSDNSKSAHSLISSYYLYNNEEKFILIHCYTIIGH